eukprot:SAG31_NODE_3860_length_3814_cov_2.455720_2_plen_99_part_00
MVGAATGNVKVSFTLPLVQPPQGLGQGHPGRARAAATLAVVVGWCHHVVQEQRGRAVWEPLRRWVGRLGGSSWEQNASGGLVVVFRLVPSIIPINKSL